MKKTSVVSLLTAATAAVVGWFYLRPRKPAPILPTEETTASTSIPLPPPTTPLPAQTGTKPSAGEIHSEGEPVAIPARFHILIMLALILAAAIIQHRAVALPQPQPERDAAFLFQYLLTSVGTVHWSSLFAVLLVPAVYLLGYSANRPLTGLFAASFTVVSGWTAALGASGTVYSTLALLSALSLVLLLYAYQAREEFSSLFFAAWLLLLLFASWLVSPLVAGLALLFPMTTLLYLRHHHRTGCSLLLSLGAALTLAMPFLFTFSNALKSDSESIFPTAISPLFTFLDAFASSLFMLVFMGDPNPAHGLLNRPVLEPVLSVIFLIGLCNWLWRVHHSGNWLDWLLPLALLVGLLPSALTIAPPVRYPDLQRAAMALPMSMVITGYGMTSMIQLLLAYRQRITQG